MSAPRSEIRAELASWREGHFRGRAGQVNDVARLAHSRVKTANEIV